MVVDVAVVVVGDDGVGVLVVDDENDCDVEKTMLIMILMHVWYAPGRVFIVIYGDEGGLLFMG